MDERQFYLLVVVETLFLIVLQVNPGKIISDFNARKACHMLTGFLMLGLDPVQYESRVFIYGVVVVSLAMLWIPNLPNWR